MEPFEVLPLDHLDGLAELELELLGEGGHPFDTEDPDLAADPDVGVVGFRLHADHLVRHLRERHRRPDYQKSAVGGPDLVVEARVLQRLVAEDRLCVAERGLAAGTVGDHFEPLAQNPVLPGALQEHPFPLDVRVAVGHVRVVVVEEEPQEVVRLHPGGQVLRDQPLARLDHLLLADLLEVLPLVPREAELLLRLKLDREPLAVPPSPEDHVLLGEGAEPIPQVLHYPPANMAYVWDPVESGRALDIADDWVPPQGLPDCVLKVHLRVEPPDPRLQHLPAVVRGERRTVLL